ncbi:hypothetical protein AA313_de0202460 [Arthrobotrys entomopaga]|nr:hypothetical protein AA313_de0202460 [Arthrobotrys entomopaga]
MAYGNVHRAFLQAVLIRPFIDIEEGRELLAAIKSVETGTDVPASAIPVKDVSEVIHAIQNTISRFDLDLRDMLDQEDGKRYYALINSANDEIIRFATTHTPDEISFFKRLLDEMFDTSNTIYAEIMAVTSMRAISLNKNPPSERENRVITTEDTNGGEATQIVAGAGVGLTKQEAEDCLTRFVDEGWLECDVAGFHYLSTRALLELEIYLKETYNVEEEEENEDGTVTKGIKKMRIKHCHFFAKAALQCPKCRKEWRGEAVGPKASKGAGGGRDAGLRRSRGRDSEGIMPQRLSKAAKRHIEKSKGRRSTMFGNHDIENVDEDDEDEVNSPAGPSRPRNSLGRRNRASTSGGDSGDERDRPPRKLSRILNGTKGISTSRRSTQEPNEDEDESMAHIKRESMASRNREEGDGEGDGDEDEDEDEDNQHEDSGELTRRMSKATLQSRRR